MALRWHGWESAQGGLWTGLRPSGKELALLATGHFTGCGSEAHFLPAAGCVVLCLDCGLSWVVGSRAFREPGRPGLWAEGRASLDFMHLKSLQQ